jgi:hypothetical protein
LPSFVARNASHRQLLLRASMANLNAMVVREGSRRIVVFLWAALQLALPGSLATLDGASALRDGVNGTSHVEEHSSKSCRPPHPAECGLCRYLSGHSVKPSSLERPLWPGVRVARPADIKDFSPSCSAVALPLSRAPPLV